ncbi:MAG: hypothetical protein R2708_14575 [Vicinamibacterales bacterium]
MSESTTACWPQRRKSAHAWQSATSFSRIQWWGTSEKPMRTK